MEVLENRELLTVIWQNQGASNGDNFDAIYGSNATQARAIVNHAIADWNATIISSTTLNIAITASSIATTSSAGETTITDLTPGGIPKSAIISLDNDGGSNGWYFDPSIGTDAEFSVLRTAFYGEVPTGSSISGVDFYAVALHEIGHALGYSNQQIASGQVPKISQYLTNSGPGILHFQSPVGSFSLDLTTAGGLHSSSEFDLMSVGSNTTHRRLISDQTVLVLSGAYGYDYHLPSDRDNLMMDTSYDSGSPVTTIRGDLYDSSLFNSGYNATSILLQDNYTLISVGPTGFYGPLPLGAFYTERAVVGSQIVYVGSSAPDAIFLTRQSAVSRSITVNGNGGVDTVTYNAGGGQYFTSVVGNVIEQRPSGSAPVNSSFVANVENLVVYGTDSDDTIKLKNNSFGKIDIFGKAGNDFVDAWDNGSLTTSGKLYAAGGAGNDVIWGTPNADILLGNDGNDTLWGGAGRDILVGGIGVDTIGANESPAEEDIVVGGSTVYDNFGYPPYAVPYGPQFGQFSALYSILDEWNSSRSRSQRIANIQGSGSQPQLNNGLFLNSSTVIDDGLQDSISVAVNIDWIILS